MPTDDWTDLGGIKLFSRLDSETLRNLEERCLRYEFAANQTILDRGNHAQHDIYFVIRGTVRIVNYAPSGREIAFANVCEGGYFGEFSALTGKPRSASVVAVTDCHLAAVKARVFRRLLLDNPELGLRLIRRLADFVRRCDKRIMDLGTLGAVQRIHAELLRLAEPDVAGPGTWVVRSLPRYSDIADRAGTTRGTVASAMNQLAVAGVIECEENTLYVRDHERLAGFAEDGAAQMLAAR